MQKNSDSKLMALDYGSKKIGVALSDTTQFLAFPYALIENKGHKELLKEVKKIAESEDVEKIIMGESLNYEMKDNPIMKEAREFGNLLEKKVGLSVEFESEILTTAQAARTQEKKNIDASAAALILQSYLDKKNANKL